jgi:hypothetical protein
MRVSRTPRIASAVLVANARVDGYKLARFGRMRPGRGRIRPVWNATNCCGESDSHLLLLCGILSVGTWRTCVGVVRFGTRFAASSTPFRFATAPRACAALASSAAGKVALDSRLSGRIGAIQSSYGRVRQAPAYHPVGCPRFVSAAVSGRDPSRYSWGARARARGLAPRARGRTSWLIGFSLRSCGAARARRTSRRSARRPCRGARDRLDRAAAHLRRYG